MSRFQGTNLPDDVGVRKMGLDLLQKINTVWDELYALLPFPSTGTGAYVRAIEPTIYGAIPIMNSTTQTVDKTIPSGYNAIVYGTYDIGTTTLTIDGDFIVL